MVKNNIRTFTVLNKLHEQEVKFKRELAKTFLEYLETLSTNKRIEQIESVLYETSNKKLPTLDRRLTSQEKKCLFLASKGKAIKETASILGLSQRTVKYHRANITKKLEAPNLMAAVASEIQYNTTNDIDNICLSLSTAQNFQMFPDNIQTIANALDKIFSINLFLINQDGKIHWANNHMLKSSQISELKHIRGKHVSIFGDKLWLNTKKIVESKKGKILYESFKNRNYIAIKVPYAKNEFYGVIGLSIDVTFIKNKNLFIELNEVEK